MTENSLKAEPESDNVVLLWSHRTKKLCDGFSSDAFDCDKSNLASTIYTTLKHQIKKVIRCQNSKRLIVWIEGANLQLMVANQICGRRVMNFLWHHSQVKHNSGDFYHRQLCVLACTQTHVPTRSACLFHSFQMISLTYDRVDNSAR